MSENDILLDKARRRFSVGPRCKHEHQTLCQHTDPDFGWFVAWQCDDCGMVTQREVTADQLETADLPYVDAALWEQAIDNTNRDRLMPTLSFFAKTLRP